MRASRCVQAALLLEILSRGGAFVHFPLARSPQSLHGDSAPVSWMDGRLRAPLLGRIPFLDYMRRCEQGACGVAQSVTKTEGPAPLGRERDLKGEFARLLDEVLPPNAGAALRGLLLAMNQAVKDGTFVKASLSQNKGPDKTLKNAYIKLVDLKKLGAALCVVSRYKTNDITKNYDAEEAEPLLRSLFEIGFQQAHLFTTKGDWQLMTGKKPSLKRVGKGPSFDSVPDRRHDVPKNTLIAPAAKFLQTLGVTGSGGKPKAGMADKLRQIQKFVEIVDRLVTEASLVKGSDAQHDALRVVDMGCGKGYLTFAMHHHLVEARGLSVETQGVEMRKDLVAKTNAFARELEMSPGDRGLGAGMGLSFVQGMISPESSILPGGSADILVALHACDTATDDAIFSGIQANSSIIIPRMLKIGFADQVAPCCHKEVRRQMDSATKPNQEQSCFLSVLRDVVSHGILCERIAEISTDAVVALAQQSSHRSRPPRMDPDDLIRALLLESQGYRTAVFEFVAGQHTAKNLMITAVRDGKPRDQAQLQERLHRLMDFHGIEGQRLATLLYRHKAVARQADGIRYT